MNGKTKIAVIAGLMLVAVASVVYAAPVLAYMNGSSDQTRERDRDRLRDQTCSCDCLQTQNQTCAQLRLRECMQNDDRSIDRSTMKHTPRIRAMFVMLEPRRSPSETDMFPTTIAFMATNSSGSDVEKATKRKLSTDFLSLRFSDTATKLDMTTPLDPPSSTNPIASNSGDGKIIREHVHS